MAEDVKNAIENLELCIGALRKQLPKKPYTPRNGTGYICSECGWGILPLEENNYCPFCGQAIDWEEL